MTLQRTFVLGLLFVQTAMGVAMLVEVDRAAGRKEWRRVAVWAAPCALVLAVTALAWQAVP